jgi:hypothetical protein
MASCGRLVTGPFRVAEGMRRLTTAAQLAKLPHKYRPYCSGLPTHYTRLAYWGETGTAWPRFLTEPVLAEPTLQVIRDPGVQDPGTTGEQIYVEKSISQKQIPRCARDDKAVDIVNQTRGNARFRGCEIAANRLGLTVIPSAAMSSRAKRICVSQLG